MSQEESTSTRPSRPRSRANRDHQPTVAQLTKLGIKVRDFIHDSTLPPVRTVYRQPRQIQPSVTRQLHREDTEPLAQSQPDSRHVIGRTVTEPVLEEAGPSIARELGGFLEINGSTDRIVNFQLFCLHPETPEYSQVIQPLIASRMFVPTPTVTPNGSLQWKEPPTLPERNTPPMMLSHLTSHPHHSLSGSSSPLAPLPPSPPTRQGSSFLSNRSPSMASLQKPFPKRRKISIGNNSRPSLKRYYLRKRPLSSASRRFHPAALSPASPLSCTVDVRSDQLPRTNSVESGSSSSRPLHKRSGTSKGRRRPGQR